MKFCEIIFHQILENFLLTFNIIFSSSPVWRTVLTNDPDPVTELLLEIDVCSNTDPRTAPENKPFSINDEYKL